MYKYEFITASSYALMLSLMVGTVWVEISQLVIVRAVVDHVLVVYVYQFWVIFIIQQ